MGRIFGLEVAEPEAVGLSSYALEKFVAALQREIGAGHAPGAAIAIGRRGRIGFVGAYGALRPDGPPTPLDALYRIYSMTKPIVSVAAMTLVEEGRLFLTDPVSKYIPAFGRVGGREMTIHDLFRHTSGLCYGFTGDSEAQRQVLAANLVDTSLDPVEAMERLAVLPLMHPPGAMWEYGLSTDVLGHAVEIVAGAPLGEVLRARIFGPLGMDDTAFYTPPEKLARRAEAFSLAMFDTARIDKMNHTAPPRFEMAGTGLISTLGDYVRFCAMLAGGGAFDGARVIGPRTLGFMASDHLGELPRQDTPLLPPGHGFGLGFAVRTAPGLAPTPGAVGDFFWGGVAGTAFVISPKLDMFAVLMVQAPDFREHFRNLFRNMLAAAIR